jgi:hypothetical protein
MRFLSILFTLLCIGTSAIAGTYDGLWIGEIKINNVSEAVSKTDATTPVPVANPFLMKIILHVDASNQIRLLRDVTIMQKRYTENNVEMVKRVLVTDNTLLPNFEGVVRRDGDLVGIRIGSLAFDFDPDLNAFLVDGTFGAGRTISVSLPLVEDHPTNPFMHKYHPDHVKGKAISRSISLKFDTVQDTNDPASGQSQLIGMFQESVTGLHKAAINAEGRFVLKRVSLIANLNDQ